MPPSSSAYTPWDNLPHLLARILCVLTLCLLFVGAMVTSTNSGLSVPDWPTTFGQNMFAYPLSQMRGGVVYEHSHRLFASAIGMLTILLVVSLFIWESRRWVRNLSLIALLLVCAQGVLGGLTVKFKLPVSVASAHAGTAELFFCCIIWLMWATSPKWKRKSDWQSNGFSTAAFILMALTFVQIIVGAVMRHSYAGLAIPTFPRAYGEWIPPFWTSGIVLNFLHTRIGPLLFVPGCLIFAFVLLQSPRKIHLGWTLLSVLTLQVALGILTVLSHKVPLIASIHLAVGALLLGTLLTIGLLSGKQSSPLRTRF